MGETPPSGFLPPEPAGPEPDLSRRPPAPPPAPPAPDVAPPPPPAPAGYAPPGFPAPGQDNGPAVLGFTLSLSSLGLLLVSAGLSSLVSVGLAIPGILQSRKGTRRVQEGLTTKSASLASAGYVIGIVALVLSVVATLFWIVVAILVATDEDARREFEREFDRQREEQAALTVLLVAARLIGVALS